MSLPTFPLMDSPTNSPAVAYQLKISLVDSEPEIWRRVIVPAHMDLKELHWVIQQAMGWERAHTYAFHLKLAEQKVKAEPSQLLADVSAHDEPLYYTYDFESGWLHRITTEAVEAQAERPVALPTCTDGAGACPPEGTGGVWGYGEFLDRLEDPEDPEYMSLIETYSDFNPDTFDVAQAAERLQAKFGT